MSKTEKNRASREAALAELVSEHGESVYRFALRQCRNAHDAEDLVQETFLKVFRNWEQFDGRSKVTTWLYTIAARTCSRMRRKRTGEPARMESMEELFPFSDEGVPDLSDNPADPAYQVARVDLRECMEKAIVALPTPFRHPLILKDILEMPIDEVARVLGVKPGTVKTRLHRARLKLRKELTSELPCRHGAKTSYSKRVCLDLLQAKQEALDRGLPFPVGPEVTCERCRNVFATLDLARYVCGDLKQGRIPPALLRKLHAQMSASAAG